MNEEDFAFGYKIITLGSFRTFVAPEWPEKKVCKIEWAPTYLLIISCNLIPHMMGYYHSYILGPFWGSSRSQIVTLIMQFFNLILLIVSFNFILSINVSMRLDFQHLLPKATPSWPSQIKNPDFAFSNFFHITKQNFKLLSGQEVLKVWSVHESVSKISLSWFEKI